ncbi:hypothetical protein MSAN_00006700 [Mycena sanguinolenta]|uniref:Uncharacterized protein n=1 Tax=Mycena sanguinolenta TaxID=230812 RepID=A0A8H6ZBJ9_9AGAR|nr:hypothetical protein MSAN_00006700 [Mycena sanguinolenta]
MATDVMSCFYALDELVQVIYQGMEKFVVLSDISDKWNIHLGQTGPEGRWWCGSWSAADVRGIVGKSASETLLESFAGKLAESIVDGELFVAVEGERYKLTLGPASKKPMHVELKEMTSTEAAAYAADVFAMIALNAQSRKSRLNPSAVDFTSASVPSRPPPAASSSSSKPATGNAKAPTDDDVEKKPAGKPEKKATGSSDKKAQEEIKALKAQLEKQQQKKRHASPEEIPKATVVPRPLKGASLANPNKKARKYQALEFESDDE